METRYTDEYLRQVADTLAACNGNQAEAARRLNNTPRSTVQNAIKRAAELGYISDYNILPGYVIKSLGQTLGPDGRVRSTSIRQAREPGPTFQAPAGHQIKGVSAFMDAEGRVIGQWVKTRDGSIGDGLVEALKDALEAYTGLAPLSPAPEGTSNELLTVYPVTDLHFGMMSWGKETGEDYDLKVAARTVRQTFDSLISRSPPSGHAMVAFMGDLLHQNDQSNTTPRSRHQLDVDGRYPMVLGEAADTLLHIVGRVLQKHDTVWICVVPGNHDPEAAAALHLALRVFYASHPRVTIEPVPKAIVYRRWGASLLGFQHGHLMPPERMAHAMAADRPEDWGQTTCRRFYSGHYHRAGSKDVGAVWCEYLGTPIPRDAHAWSSGWRAERAMKAIHFHHDRGETGTTSVFVR